MKQIGAVVFLHPVNYNLNYCSKAKYAIWKIQRILEWFPFFFFFLSLLLVTHSTNALTFDWLYYSLFCSYIICHISKYFSLRNHASFNQCQNANIHQWFHVFRLSLCLGKRNDLNSMIIAIQGVSEKASHI